MASEELKVVIPVYNEEASLPALIADWRRVLNSIPVRSCFLFIDDGSTDGSLNLLRTIQQTYPDILVHSQPNAGHGPAILTGYRMALDAEWILQLDSDHQLDPSAFTLLWHHRQGYDLLVGQRQDKNATIGRRWISTASTLLIRLLYGRGVKDVNSPFRLFRSSRLAEALPHIPSQTFAPNVLLTAWFLQKGARVRTMPVLLRADTQLRTSRMNGYFLKGSLQALLQTILFRFRL
jgi:dolichol-phosphate mannosyltransferase